MQAAKEVEMRHLPAINKFKRYGRDQDLSVTSVRVGVANSRTKLALRTRHNKLALKATEYKSDKATNSKSEQILYL